jgi:hypothetical protein
LVSSNSSLHLSFCPNTNLALKKNKFLSTGQGVAHSEPPAMVLRNCKHFFTPCMAPLEYNYNRNIVDAQKYSCCSVFCVVFCRSFFVPLCDCIVCPSV